jgi:ubiquinol-cytochrome c reductase iron-sulfur subunit
MSIGQPADVSIGQPADNSRRTWIIATCVVGGVAGVATAYPFLDSMEPSEAARAAGAPVEVDIAGMAYGEQRTAEWRGQPIWIVRRTPEMLANLAKNDPELADPESKRNTDGPDALNPPFACKNEWRSVNKEYLVLVGICTHLGCSPGSKFASGAQPGLPSDWDGGWLCPCHGSTFDLAGRVYKNKPAPDNLRVPPYRFLSATRLLIGEMDKA